MNLLGLWCWITKRHKWRKARKGEAANVKICRRCGLVRSVTPRITVTATPALEKPRDTTFEVLR